MQRCVQLPDNDRSRLQTTPTRRLSQPPHIRSWDAFPLDLIERVLVFLEGIVSELLSS
jgi:hypothetical protein